MKQGKYQLRQTPKTTFLNFFRKALTISPVEKLIVKYSSENPGAFWNKVIPPDYLYKKGSIRKVERDGVKFTLDISNCVQHGLYYFGFGEGLIDIVKKEIKKTKVIFDIGAHIGTTSIMMSRLNPEATIFAFEPHSGTYNTAAEILRTNSFKNIQINNIGLGDKPGKLKLYEVREHNAGMNRVILGEQDYPYTQVDISTIDKFVSENSISNVGFIKIDVEGFEYAVLKGGEQTLRKYKPVMFIELDDNNLKDCGQSAASLIELLFSYGYETVIRTNTLQKLNEKSDFTNCHFDILVK